MAMLTLPSDVLIIVLQSLTTAELAHLAQTCRFLNALVHDFGWSAYLRCHEHPSFSLSQVRISWNPHQQVRYNALSDQSWSRAKFAARPLSRPWLGKLQPQIAICPSRLLVAAGSFIYLYRFTHPRSVEDAPGVKFECSYNLADRNSVKRDITSLVFAPDGGMDRTALVGFQDGAIERVFFPAPEKLGGQSVTLERARHHSYHFHSGDLVESLSRAGNYLLSLSSAGIAAFSSISDSSLSPPHLINIKARSWSSLLSLRSSTPYAVFGTASSTPLAVHSITNAAFDPTPFATLHSKNADFGTRRSSAVYGISEVPQSCPWGASDQIIVSGWYDGMVRVHDLRSSARASGTEGLDGAAPLLPVLSLYDPWSFEPIYSVSCGGGSSSHIAAGSARHSVVAFWDVRHPTRGWSVHAPGNDSSPVYALVAESSRVFGATQSRPFVYDFGPGVSNVTYPLLSSPRVDENLKLKKNGIGYYVTKYNHSRMRE